MYSPIRLAIVDDHPLVQKGIQLFLSNESDIDVVGTGINEVEAQYICRTLQPDVILLDLYMPDSSALSMIEFAKIHCPNIKVLVFSAFNDPITVQNVMSAGISGYVLKEEAPELLLHAIRTVMKGATWFSRSILDQLVAHPKSTKPQPPYDHLTEREWDILKGIARGWGNARISKELHLAEQTVRNYTGRIYEIIGVGSRTEAVLWAIEHGLSR